MLAAFALLFFVPSVIGKSLPCVPVRWCTTSQAEQDKCMDLSQELHKEGTFNFFQCVKGIDRYDCMQKIEGRSADLITLDAADAYVAGRYHNLMPLMLEKIDTEVDQMPYFYHSTIVLPKHSTIKSMEDLRGKKSCHTGVGRTVGWMIPISILRSMGLLDNSNCLNSLESVAQFFNKSCAYGAKSDKYNPLGYPVNIQALCDLCEDKNKCDVTDKYAGYDGAFRCLADGVGDVAFVKESVIFKNTNGTTEVGRRAEDFKLLCPDGTHKPFEKYKQCNWGFRPAQSIMTGENRNKFEKFIMTSMLEFMDQHYGSNSNSDFKLFESQDRYKERNVLFRDGVFSLWKVKDESYRANLGDTFLKVMEHLHPCPDLKARWCVVSDYELAKCYRMRDAFMSRRLRPEIECIKATNYTHCMQLINEDEADLVALDGGDIYTGGRDYNLIPIAYENYGEEDASYWAVAVAKKGSNIDLTSLKGTKSCHTGIGRTAGWNIPIGYLISSGQLNSTCDVVKEVEKFFKESCVPGVLDEKYNPLKRNTTNLCKLCAGENANHCRRDSSEPYYSYAGAFRCLVEGNGDVAFVKHTTVPAYTNGISKDTWAMNLSSSDYELLCPDGTRKSISDYKKCNLAKVPSHAVMTSRKKSNYKIELYLTLLLQGQTYYQDDTNRYFKMFDSDQYVDLIFKDSTIELKVIPKLKRFYDKWLTKSYIKMYQISNMKSC